MMMPHLSGVSGVSDPRGCGELGEADEPRQSHGDALDRSRHDERVVHCLTSMRAHVTRSLPFMAMSSASLEVSSGPLSRGSQDGDVTAVAAPRQARHWL
jgi:hypothetical protein